jgi:hypothetical protein
LQLTLSSVLDSSMEIANMNLWGQTIMSWTRHKLRLPSASTITSRHVSSRRGFQSVNTYSMPSYGASIGLTKVSLEFTLIYCS